MITVGVSANVSLMPAVRFDSIRESEVFRKLPLTPLSLSLNTMAPHFWRCYQRICQSCCFGTRTGGNSDQTQNLISTIFARPASFGIRRKRQQPRLQPFMKTRDPGGETTRFRKHG